MFIYVAMWVPVANAAPPVVTAAVLALNNPLDDWIVILSAW